ncbi:MAG: hypothetical protein K8R87_14305 [Verrucomicrobia bacterium]|nr:hypothetical protein [Verrucomicrobiota bacterium]
MFIQSKNLAPGLTRIGFGLAKIILLAAPLGVIANGAFSAGTGSLTTITAWIGVTAFAFQIAFIFSGVSDIATGLACALGFHLPHHFDSPYQGTSITDFWRRWSIPGIAHHCVNLLLTLIIGALWLGPRWSLLVWLALHGGVMALERWMEKFTANVSAPQILRIAFTFFILLVTWVFFRADSLAAAAQYLGVMFGGGTQQPTALLLQSELTSGFNVLQLLIASVIVWFLPNTQNILRRFTWWKALLGLILFIAAVVPRKTVQDWLTHEAEQGNRQVYIGYNKMLFYQPDLDALTGRGPHEARDVIIKFAAQLKERGVALLIVPVPSKPMIYPELVIGDTRHDWMTHPDAPAFYQALRTQGINVLDLTADFAKLRDRRRHVFEDAPDSKDKTAVAQAKSQARELTKTFLKQDTHWTPEAMRFTADKVAAYVKLKFPQTVQPQFKMIRAVDSVERKSTGDLVELLDLDHATPSFAAERVLLQVVGEGTEDRDSPVVLLGDSFVNIYDDPALGFENPAKPKERISAGFAQTLAQRLQQPLDVIAINGSGSIGVRKALAARPDHEIRTKKLVIWVMAARDLLLSKDAARAAGVEWTDVTFKP